MADTKISLLTELATTDVVAGDWLPIVDTSTGTTKKVDAGVFGNGPNVVTVGAGGMYATVTDAVTYINTTTRYTVIYDTGTATLTNGAKAITPSGGADFTDSAITGTANRSELWLYLDSADVFLPLQGMAPPLGTVTPATSWGDYGELKYNYEGTGAAKSYELIKPNWYTIVLQPGETYDDTLVDWPLFTTLQGVDRESSIFRGSIVVDTSRPGFWASNVSWSAINGVAPTGSQEESFISVEDEVAAEEGYAEIVLQNISGGRGNADRDVVYRTSIGAKNGHALLQCIGSVFYSNYDAFQAIARNCIFKNNDIYVATQDTTTFEPTGFRWYSGTTAPETDLFLDFSGNNFFISGAAGAKQANGMLFIPDNVTYLSAPPDVYGRVYNNYIQVHQLGTGNATGIGTAANLFGANDGRLLIDANTFDLVSSGGTLRDIWTHASVSPLVLGANNVTKDGSALAITGAPFRSENHGLSAAIASGATIAHGMRATPTMISVLPTGAKTDVYATVDGTNITVNYGGGGTSTFHWKAEL